MLWMHTWAVLPLKVVSTDPVRWEGDAIMQACAWSGVLQPNKEAREPRYVLFPRRSRK